MTPRRQTSKGSLPAGMDVLQAAFKKAAWYSFSFTTIVAVRVVGTFSSFDVGQRRRSDKINTPINEVPLPSSRITCLVRGFLRFGSLSACVFVTFHGYIPSSC